MKSLQGTLPNLLTFCAAMEHDSFSEAARRLGVTPQAASRSIVRLEATLGVRLFRRTTRSVTPTDEARAYYATAKQALELLSRAESEVARPAGRERGVVRLSVPTSFGHHRLLPELASFRERYPDIQLDLHVGNRNVDFARDGFDLAVRQGVIRDQALVARKLGDFALGVYASPSYLARRGTPRSPSQLAGHDCIGFVMPSTGKALPWAFAAGAHGAMPPFAMRCSDDVLALLTLARAGVGLVQTYDYLAQGDVTRGLVREVLREYRGATRPFSLIYPRSPAPSPAARAMIAFIMSLR